jgi:hypothetical protein
MGQQSKRTVDHRTGDRLEISDLCLHGPALDFDGFWLFCPLRSASEVRGLKIGFSIGRYEGSDLGMATPGDPNSVRYHLELITEQESISYSVNLSRLDVSSSPSEFDIIVGLLGRIRGSWPRFELEMTDPDHELSVNLRFGAKTVHWWPDIVMPRTTYRQYVLPDTEVKGTISLRGQIFEVSGLGAFDRPFGRLVSSPTSRGIGYWHYDVIMWDEEFTTVSWLVSDRDGQPTIAYGMGSLGQGQSNLSLFEHFELEYLEFEERGQGRRMPRKWRGTLSGEDGHLVYTVNAIGQRYDAAILGSSRCPTLLMQCDAHFTDGNGVRQLAGIGLPEYHVAHFDPLQI